MTRGSSNSRTQFPARCDLALNRGSLFFACLSARPRIVLRRLNKGTAYNTRTRLRRYPVAYKPVRYLDSFDVRELPARPPLSGKTAADLTIRILSNNAGRPPERLRVFASLCVPVATSPDEAVRETTD